VREREIDRERNKGAIWGGGFKLRLFLEPRAQKEAVLPQRFVPDPQQTV